MGVWSTTTPAGSDLLSQGDDKIREMKTAIQEALRAGEVAGDNIEGVEAIFPGASPSSAPVYRYRGLAGITADRPTAGQYGFYFDTTRKVLQRDNGTSWEDVGQVVLDSSITEAKLSSSVAGNGLSGGANTPLSVNVGSGLEISSDAVRIAAAAAGNGLSGGAGSALSVNVDGSTIEIYSDALRVKDGGISASKLVKTTGTLSNVTVSGGPVSVSVSGHVTKVTCSWSGNSGSQIYNPSVSVSYGPSSSFGGIASSGSLDSGAYSSTITFGSSLTGGGVEVLFSSIAYEKFLFPT